MRIGFSLRVIMRKRQPSVSLGWLVVILLLPFVGAIIYLLFGETRLGQKRAARAASELHILTDWADNLQHRAQVDWEGINPECRPLHTHAQAVIGLPALPGNHLELIDDAHDFLKRLVQDINNARTSCFLEFYIWQDTGLVEKVTTALIDASRRGVTCRVLLDSIGSGEFLAGETVDRLHAANIEVVEALPAGVFRALFVRVDLRNHRKIVVIDGKIAYTGSQNLVDPSYYHKTEGIGPWIDTMVRVQGPIVEVIGAAFLYDWILETDGDVDHIIRTANVYPVPPAGDAAVQLAPSGPGVAEDAIHNLLLTTIYAARKELVLTSPYFVPDNAILTALKSAAQRNVAVTIILPGKNDSKLVHFASMARYSELARAGVRIMIFREGLLHSKTITVDGDFSLIGSVNLDMRSFWLNFELTLFVYNKNFTKKLRDLQEQYIRAADHLERTTHKRRPTFQRFLENCALLLGPLL